MYLYGASGHAKVIIDILKACDIPIEGLVDDNPELHETPGIRIIHGRTDCFPILVSIGNNRIRKKIAEQLNGEFGLAVHPSAIVSTSARLGPGSVVMQGAIIQSNYLLPLLHFHKVWHWERYGQNHQSGTHGRQKRLYSRYNATLCGNVEVREGSWIGAGSILIPGVKIGKWSVIGAGSVVTKDIPDGVLAVGNRCKIIKSIVNNE